MYLPPGASSTRGGARVTGHGSRVGGPPLPEGPDLGKKNQGHEKKRTLSRLHHQISPCANCFSVPAYTPGVPFVA